MKLRNILLKAIGSIGAISLGFSTSFLAIQAPSLAQNREICNNTGEKISIALGYRDGFSKGWYIVDRNLCLNLSNFDNSLGSPKYYYAQSYYANVFNNSRTIWNGNKAEQFCVTNSGFALTRSYLLDSLVTCAGNSAAPKSFGFIGSGKNLTP